MFFIIPALSTVLTFWAGYELAMTSSRAQLAGLLYGAVGLATAAYNLSQIWPTLAAFRFDYGQLLVVGELLGGVILLLVVLWFLFRKPGMAF